MNHTLGLWKQLEGDSTEVSESSSKSASSGLSATSGKRSNTLKGKDKNSNAPLTSKLDDVKPIDVCITKDVEQEAAESKEKRTENHSTLGAKRVLFPAKPKPSKVKENGSNKSQVVQSSDEEIPEASSSSQAKNAVELSLIRNQITQIEKQQSSLLDLFQVNFFSLNFYRL